MADFFPIMVQALPSIAQAIIIGAGSLRVIMKHTIRYNPMRCVDSNKASNPKVDFPCMDVVAARGHRFIASMGLGLTALASNLLATNQYLRTGDICVAIAVGTLYVTYMAQEKTRGQMEQEPKSWYDTNRELLYAVVCAFIGVALAIASQEIR
jgi:hypothetical protein